MLVRIDDRGFDARLVSSDPVGGAAAQKRQRKKKEQERSGGLVQTTVAVEGMTCGACTSAIEGGFKNVAGVQSFTVSLITERAVAVHDPGVLSAEKVAEMWVVADLLLVVVVVAVVGLWVAVG